MVAATLLPFAACWTTACTQRDAQGGGPPGGRGGGGGGAVPVLVAHATTMNIPIELRGVGVAEASASVDVKAQIAGQIMKVHFVEGQEVRAGELLFSIDARPYEAALDRARAEMEQDRADLKQSEADLARNAVLWANARQEEERQRALAAQKVISQDEYGKTKTAADALKVQAESLQAAVEVSRQAVAASEATVRAAEVDLSYCTIRAPIAGRTGQLPIHEGGQVRGGDTTLVVIKRLHPIYVSFSIPEQYLAEVRRAMAEGTLPVRATPRAESQQVVAPNPPTLKEEEQKEQEDRKEPGAAPAGALDFIDNTVDRMTGTIMLRATFANEDNRLWPGQFVETRLKVREIENAVVIPDQAVQVGQQGEYVFVVGGDNTVAFRAVTTGETIGDLVQIREGIEPGEKVVTDGQLRLAPGMPIEEKRTVSAE